MSVEAGGFASITSGVISMLGAPHVPTGELAGSGAGAAFLGFPYDGANAAIERPGSANGPRGLRIASNMCFPWSFEWDIDLFETYGLVDCGDSPLAIGNVVRTHELVQAEIRTILEAGAIPITIGGDGSVTVPVARAVGKKYPKMAALHIDSHTDSYPYGAEEKYNSATQFTHVAEEGLVDPEFSWHVGIRSTTYAQGVVPRAMSLGYKVVSIDELIRGGFAQRMAEFRDKVGKRPVYLCFDMDVFDPSCAPGVCTPSWGGLSAREGIDLLRCLTDLNIVAVDVNTVSPPQDVNGMAAHLCAHVIYETLYTRDMGLNPHPHMLDGHLIEDDGKRWTMKLRAGQTFANPPFQAGFPDLTVLLTFGHSLPRTKSRGGQVPLSKCEYGLLAPFLDGSEVCVQSGPIV